MNKENCTEEIKVKIIEDKSTFDLAFVKQLVLLAFGSLIFLGVIEGYKSDLGSDKNLVKEYYRPLKISYTECAPLHNTLFMKYGELAGSYQLLFNEIKYMFENPIKMNRVDYQALPISILKTNTTLKKDIENLKSKVEKCRVKVYSNYEELALVSGTFHEYEKLSKLHFGIINKQHAELKKLIPNEFKEMEPSYLVDTMRKMTTLDFSSEESRKDFYAEIDFLSKPLIEYETNKMMSEQEIFQENQKFHLSLRNLFLSEINRRNSQGFLSWLF